LSIVTPSTPDYTLLAHRIASSFTMPTHKFPEHHHTNVRSSSFFEPDELRRRRHEKQLEIRKQKRQESLAKMRGLSLDGEKDPVSTQARRSIHHKKVQNELRYELVKRKIHDNPLPVGHPTHIGSYKNIVNWPVFVPLLKVPAEIRLNIYEYALQGDEGEYEITEAAGIPEPPLLNILLAQHARHSGAVLLPRPSNACGEEVCRTLRAT
jgi:hypothetical protein